MLEGTSNQQQEDIEKTKSLQKLSRDSKRKIISVEENLCTKQEFETTFWKKKKKGMLSSLGQEPTPLE